MFDGDVNGRFRAFDDRNGEILWGFTSGSPVSGFPITYAVDGNHRAAVRRAKPGQADGDPDAPLTDDVGCGASAFESPCRVIRAVCGAGEAGVELPVASVQPSIDPQGNVAFNPLA